MSYNKTNKYIYKYIHKIYSLHDILKILMSPIIITPNGHPNLLCILHSCRIVEMGTITCPNIQRCFHKSTDVPKVHSGIQLVKLLQELVHPINLHVVVLCCHACGSGPMENTFNDHRFHTFKLQESVSTPRIPCTTSTADITGEMSLPPT